MKEGIAIVKGERLLWGSFCLTHLVYTCIPCSEAFRSFNVMNRNMGSDVVYRAQK